MSEGLKKLQSSTGLLSAAGSGHPENEKTLKPALILDFVRYGTSGGKLRTNSFFKQTCEKSFTTCTVSWYSPGVVVMEYLSQKQLTICLHD
jgi:hypothetical protein